MPLRRQADQTEIAVIKTKLENIEKIFEEFRKDNKDVLQEIKKQISDMTGQFVQTAQYTSDRDEHIKLYQELPQKYASKAEVQAMKDRQDTIWRAMVGIVSFVFITLGIAILSIVVHPFK